MSSCKSTNSSWLTLQEKPLEAERLKDKQVGVSEEDTIYGVRMGAGDRSYLVRDKKIEVLKNVRGGVEVRLCLSLARVLIQA